MRTGSNQPMKVHLAFWSFFWRAFVWMFLIGEFFLAIQIGKFGLPANQKVGAFVFFSLRILAYTSTAAIVMTLIAEFVVRLVIRPVVNAWQKPPAGDVVASFHLDVREALMEVVPARWKRGRLWSAGSLIRTDQRICFMPKAWDGEPLWLRLDEVDSVGTAPPPRMFFGFVQGIPPYLTIRSKRGDEHLFTVADPDHVRASLCPTESALVSWIG